MENLIILPNQFTPFVHADFERGELVLMGKSTPKTFDEIMKPIEGWLMMYFEKSPKNLTLHFDLCHYNSQSSLMITGLFRFLNDHRDSSRVSANWYHFTDDFGMIENGKNYQTSTNYPVTLIEDFYTPIISIKRTELSPLIYLDNTGDFIIEGNCKTENPFEFYRSTIKQLCCEQIKPTLKSLSLSIHLKTVLPSNLPYIKAIIGMVDTLSNCGINTKIEWIYSDTDIEALGLECLSHINSHYFFRKM